VVKISVYARSDVMSVAIPASDGGCGGQHSRPVVQGAPAKMWKLTCGPCETAIKRDIRASTVEWTDKDHVKHEHNTSTWGDDPTRIPLTPDEERVSQSMEKEGKASMAQAFQGMAQALISEQRKASAADVDDAVLAQARGLAVDRVAALEAELQQLRDMISAKQQPGIAEPVITGTSSGKVTSVRPFISESLTDPVKVAVLPDSNLACPGCGGTLRKPGARGPAPKLCADCKPQRSKTRVSA
jgi:hypothetical protein